MIQKRKTTGSTDKNKVKAGPVSSGPVFKLAGDGFRTGMKAYGGS